RHIAADREFIEGELQKLLRSGVRAVGFSVNSGNQLFSLELARLLKKEKPDIFTIFGGQHFFIPENAAAWLANPEADCVFRGPGDETLPLFLSALEKSDTPKPLPGMLLRGRNGELLDGGPARPVEDLDALPFADFTVLPVELYSNKLHIPFQSSRGCIWKCRYCSATNFWQGYRQMSGERMFAELMHHKSLFPDRTHVEFYDLTANGRIDSLHKLSELLIEDHKANGWKNFFGWKINAVVRPEMTPELLKKLRQSFCKDIIYGIESGSEKVLRLMNKNYRPETALQVLRDSHAADIHTTANFMFGFPGESEEDFGKTLSFLEQAAPHLDRVYASATFTSLEEGSHLTAHRQDFGIKIPPPDSFHNLYWESEDGTNNYPVRMKRYKRFRARAIELGLDAYKGVQGDLEQSSLLSLAEFYRYKGDHIQAIENLLAAFDINSSNEAVLDALAPYYGDLCLFHSAARQFLRLLRAPSHARRKRLEQRIARLTHEMRDKAVFESGTNPSLNWMASPLEPQKLSYLLRLTHETLSSFRPAESPKHATLHPLLSAKKPDRLQALLELQRRNVRFNSLECSQNRSLLGTYPRRVFLQMDGPCNADCVFCSRDSAYENFSLDKYLSSLHGRLRPLLRHAEEVLFTGSGEFLLLPEAERIIAFFNQFFPHLEKQLATNASHKNKRLWELICSPQGRYTVQVSLHSADPETHKKMTDLPSFDDVMANLEYLASQKSATGHPRLHLMFVMTTGNIHNLPDFVRLGARLKADKLIANHAYIYRPEQQKYSLHGHPESDKWLAQAYAEAEKLGLKVSFPPLFSQGAATTASPSSVCCHEPWTQLMVNPRGDTLPCDIYGKFSKNLLKLGFWEIWNGAEYRAIRADIRNKSGCLARCPRHNPASLQTAENLQIQRQEGAK
ncbi:MAG TPA: radical SAM protein, partial [Elusimicrobiales bacterium]|nr:radical SAM protein [Elusimicrobiales bacterium]